MNRALNSSSNTNYLEGLMETLKSLSEPAKLAFANSVLAEVSRAPLGGIGKSELDYIIFVGLLRAGYISIDSPVFETAQLLQVTPAKVNALMYSYRMRTQKDLGVLAELAAAIDVVAIHLDGNVILNVEDRYWRDTLIARLKRAGVYTDTSFNRERVSVGSDRFVEVLELVFAENAQGLREAVEAERKRNAKSNLVSIIRTLPGKAAGSAAAKAGSLTLSALFTWAQGVS
ncbi:hypothetical protein [Pseudarthrobacter enclensis]|uniref:hypothetical protein n=1 Tax=Pseudarthrobacter enclensis TaxID=993070 RepID=UPI0011467404|nr:hypothetical protein [Pseudarthrobacter enclensis]